MRQAATNPGTARSSGTAQSTDGSRAGTGDRAVVRVLADVPLLLHLGQEFLDEEPGVAIAHAVILEAAIEPRLPFAVRRRDNSRRDKHGDLHGHLAFVDQVVEDRRQLPLASFADAVLDNDQTRRLFRVVLSRHVDAVLPRSVGKNSAVVERERAVQLLLRHTVFRLRVLGHRIAFLSGQRCEAQAEQSQGRQQWANHGNLVSV